MTKCLDGEALVLVDSVENSWNLLLKELTNWRELEEPTAEIGA
jgi:hypothetical protein